jgi:hypothetical protein
MTSTTQIKRIPVYALQPGDILSGTREVVVRVSAGIGTPPGKMVVVLDKYDSLRRSSIWGRHTIVGVLERGQ